MNNRDFVVRFAGDGGQGVVTASDMLARAAATVGYHVLTFATFPSQILGGPTWTQTRISPNEIKSVGDDLDILVALNLEAYETHVDEVRDGGVVIYDSKFELPEEQRALGIPLDELAKEAGESRSANMVLMGALAHLVNMPQEYFENFVTQRFKGRDAIIEANLKALKLGMNHVANTEMHLVDLQPPRSPLTAKCSSKATMPSPSAQSLPDSTSTPDTPSLPPRRCFCTWSGTWWARDRLPIKSVQKSSPSPRFWERASRARNR